MTAQHPLWAEILSPKKVHFSGSKLTCNSSGPKFTRLFSSDARGISLVRASILHVLPRSGDICDQSLKWSKIDRNFACFLPPIFLGGAPPEFLKSIYKIRPDSDHVAKFQGDRSRDLGEFNTWLKIQRLSLYNFHASGNILTKLLQET